MTFFRHPARRRCAGWLLLAALLAGGAAVARAQGAEGTRKFPPYQVGGRISSSPAIAPDGTIYLGVFYETNPQTGRLLAIPANFGQPKWQFQAPDRIESSPAIAPDGTVYVGCWNGKLYAFDPNGTGTNVAPRWHYDTGVAIGQSSPAVAPDGTIYVGSADGVLHAISPSGKKIWTHPVGNAIESTPAIGQDGTIYFGCSDTNIYALHPEDGSEKWHVTTGGEVLSSPAIGADGTVYVGSADFNVYAISPDGAKKWTFATGGRVDAPPVIGPEGIIYVGSWDFGFYAIKPDGSRLWKTSATRPIVTGAVVRGDGTVIFGADDGVLRAVNPVIGNAIWTFAPPALTRDVIEASSTIGPDGTIYYAQLDGSIYAINGNGSPLSTYASWPMRGRDAVHSGARAVTNSGAQLINLSTRAAAGGGANLIAGLVVTGEASKKFLLRGIGPTLEQSPFNVPGAMGHPKLELYVGTTKIAENADWSGDGNGSQLQQTFASVGAFALPDGSKDAALVSSLVPGPYTVKITSADDGGTGVALVEAYDAASSNASARLINLSTRARVSGTEAVTPGLVIGGSGTLRVLLRAVGPGLAAFGVGGVLARPTMNLFLEQTLVRSNEGWTKGGLKADLTAAMNAVGAFPLADGSADCAMLVTLNGNTSNYTIQVAGVGGATGEVIVEVYEVP